MSAHHHGDQLCSFGFSFLHVPKLGGSIQKMDSSVPYGFGDDSFLPVTTLTTAVFWTVGPGAAIWAHVWVMGSMKVPCATVTERDEGLGRHRLQLF